jgi:GTP cyclohydrolase I
MCVHHLLPFFGRAHVAYLPHRRLAGSSKIAAIVDALARRLQVQEVLTEGIVGAIEASLDAARRRVRRSRPSTCASPAGASASRRAHRHDALHGRLASGPRREEALRLLSAGDGAALMASPAREEARAGPRGVALPMKTVRATAKCTAP